MTKSILAESISPNTALHTDSYCLSAEAPGVPREGGKGPGANVAEGTTGTC